MPKDERIQVTQWDYKSPMDAKLIMGNDFKSDRHYRFVREDNVDTMKIKGYSTTAKKFKGMVLMETSKEKHHENQKIQQERVKARQQSFKDQGRREVNQSGRAKVYLED